MLRSYLTIALRAFRKHTLYASINVFGLAIGLSVVLLIGLFVRFELSYDRFNHKADRTYRIVQEQPGNFYLGSNHFAVTPAPLPDALINELSYVETATQVNTIRGLISPDGGTGFYSDGLFATDTFFDVFDYPLIQGDPETVIDEPNAIVLTPELAQSVFGTQDVVGRDFEITYWDDKLPVTVTGLVTEPPPNSHLDFDFILSFAGNENRAEGQWGNNSYHTYAVLNPGASVDDFESDVQDIVNRNMGELSWIKDGSGEIPRYYPQRLTDLHLRSHINFEISQNGDIRYVWLLVLAAGIIMLTACINYMNLATARAGTRAREVGIRKVSGANRTQLSRQFLGESILTAVLASLIALGITALVLPGFNQMVERDIPLSMLGTPWFLAMVPLTGLVIGLISGSYPALFLSGMAPARVLKSGGTMRTSRSFLRNSLVVGQFAVAVMLVVGTMVIQRQMTYIRKADTGINRDQVVAVQVRDQDLSTQWEGLRNELERIPGISGVTSSNHLPTNISSSNGVDDWDGHEEGQETTIYVTSVNYGYLDLLGLELAAGRDFSVDHATDEEEGLIINETTVRALGWDNESAIGKHIDLGSNGSTVIGVVKDYRFHSFHMEIQPMALYLNTDRIGRVLLKLDADGVGGTLDRIGDVMASFSPAYPFDYQFLDDAYDSMYRAERRLGLVLGVVSVLALVIACLGLFGLAAFMTLQRTREIGVRKALGAGMSDIVILLSKDFSKLMLVAFLLGSPLAWYAMHRWLSSFAFKIEIGPAIFLTAGLFMVVVALLTVGYQSIKASLTDPVKALRQD